jgi:phosphatidylserine/phosphatidylglycerophosphate/cardiolipin synthase-like enzyme
LKTAFWIAGIVGSIFAAFYLGKLIGHRVKFAKYTGFAVTAFWFLWTLGLSSIFIGYALTGPLAIFQTIVIVVAFVISYQQLQVGRKHEKAIEELKSDLLRSDNDRLRAEADKIAAGRVDVLETPAKHRDFFLTTLRNAKESVIILSGWATDYAVDEEFRKISRRALQRGVQFFIGYGYQKKGEKKQEKDYERRAREVLEELQNWCSEEKLAGRISVFPFPNHAKILIKDDEYAVSGGFNWLSNKGTSPNKERSYVIFNRDFVTAERDEIINHLDNPLGPTRRGLLKRILPWSDY